MDGFTTFVLAVTTIGSAVIVSAFILAGISRMGARIALSQSHVSRAVLIAALALLG